MNRAESEITSLKSPKPEMNIFSLSFVDPDLEEKFNEYNLAPSLRQSRISFIVAIIFYDIFGILDSVLIPQLKEAIWVIRYGIFSPIVLLIILLSFTAYYKRFVQIAIVAVVITGGFGITGMIVIASPPVNYSYYAGLILIFIFGYGFTSARFIYATIAGWIIVGLYEYTAIWVIHTPIAILINNNFFFIGANIIGMFICYAIERSTRMHFFLNHMLKIEHEKLNSANQKLCQLSMIDGLTGILNRRMFDETLTKEWAIAVREQKPLSLIMIDVDHFKSYNDTYGHLQGDECLRKIAKVLKMTAKRPADLVARYGGEEFCMILPNTGVEGAENIAGKIRESVYNLQIPHEKSPIQMVTISLGITYVLPETKKSTSLNDLTCFINHADQSLYKAKQNGRNCIVAKEFYI